jgi:hypothetical protein
MGRLAVLFVVASLAITATARAEEVIVPGKSIGPVLIGMTAQELYSAMGEPSAAKVGEEKTAYTYDGLQVGVENDSQRVYRVFATSARFKLVHGISVGSSVLAVVLLWRFRALHPRRRRRRDHDLQRALQYRISVFSPLNRQFYANGRHIPSDIAGIARNCPSSRNGR